MTDSSTRGERRRIDWTRAAQVVGLLVLCAIGAELLAAYGEGTGDPVQVAFAVVFFAGLYGAPALLVREVVRRLGWGWPSMLLLFLALGIAQACVIDQSLFSLDYGDYRGWQEQLGPTFIPALGISGHNAYAFVVGHLIFSFGAPVAVAEAWVPRRSDRPWLGRVAIAVLAAGYLGTAALVASDPSSHSAGPLQLTVSVGLMLLLIIAAAVVGAARRAGQPRPEAAGPPVLAVVTITIVAAAIPDLTGYGWPAVFLGVLATAAVGVGILVARRRWDWSIRHSAAVGLGYLLVRGGLAFSYFPLAGEVEPLPKYLHNVVMIVVVLIAGLIALRPPRSTVSSAGGRTDPAAGRSPLRGGSPRD